jgi:hypothetical protein
MARVNSTGFELGDTANNIEVAAHSGTYSYQTTIKRPGGGAYALKVNPTGTNLGYIYLNALTASGTTIDASDSFWHFRIAMRLVTLPTTEQGIFRVTNSSASIILLARINSAGKILFYDSAGTLLGTSTNTFAAGATWYLLNVYVKPGAAGSGAFKLQVNATSDTTGGDAGCTNAAVTLTPLTGATTCGRLYCGKVVDVAGGGDIEYYYDDVAISNTAFVPDGTIICLKPSGNGATYGTGWTISAGSSARNTYVDELPPNGTTDYLKSSVDAEAYSATFDSLVTSGGAAGSTINSLRLIYEIICPSGVAAFKIWCISGATAGGATTGFAAGSGGWVGISKIYETDPNTSAVWAQSAVDAIEGVVQNGAAASVEHRCSGMYVMVDSLAPQIPTVPVLLSPLQPTTMDKGLTTFSWLASTGATAWDVKIDATVIAADITTLTTDFDTSGLSTGAHTWTVRAKNPAGPSAYAAARDLTLTVPVLVGDVTVPFFITQLLAAIYTGAKLNTDSLGRVTLADKTGMSLANLSVTAASFAAGVLASQDQIRDAVVQAILQTSGQTTPTPIATDASGKVTLAPGQVPPPPVTKLGRSS